MSDSETSVSKLQDRNVDIVDMCTEYERDIITVDSGFSVMPRIGTACHELGKVCHESGTGDFLLDGLNLSKEGRSG